VSEMIITSYNSMSQLHIFKAVSKMNPNSGEKFHIELQITDGYKFVCNAIVTPLMRDHRTGEWSHYVLLGIAKDAILSDHLTKRLKDHIKEVVTELLFVMTGEW